MANQLRLVVHDVEHGSAAYLETPNGKQMIIDLGVGSTERDDQNYSPLTHLWHRYGVRKLDLAIITHPHRDHLDDIDNLHFFSPALLRPRHLAVNDIRAGNQNGGSSKIDKYLALCAQHDGGTMVPAHLDCRRPENNGGATILNFFPTRCARSNLNNHSIVTVVAYAGTKVLIPGDNEAISWRELLQDPTFVEAIRGTNILVAAHHGREAGYCEDIFEHMPDLRLTVISDGPGSDTSATAKYHRHCGGWPVRYRADGSQETRYCLTTRQDGLVHIQIGFNPSNQPFRVVSAE